MHKFTLGLAALSLLTLCGVRFVHAQDSEKPAPPEGVDPQLMMEAMRLAQPGPEHEWLASLAGEWESSVHVAMPGMPSMEQSATASSEMILGDRFLEIRSDGSFMGQPFESRVILGFDRRHGEYTLLGLDTLGTYWVSAKGVRDEDGVIRLHGEDDDPMGQQVFTFEFEVLGEDAYEHRVVFSQLGPQTFEEPFTMVRVRNERKP